MGEVGERWRRGWDRAAVTSFRAQRFLERLWHCYFRAHMEVWMRL